LTSKTKGGNFGGSGYKIVPFAKGDFVEGRIVDSSLYG